MRGIVPSNNDNASSTRKALLSCLLIFFIEHFLNSPNTALDQSQVGFRLLRELQPKRNFALKGLNSPDGPVVDDVLFHEFEKLDLRHAMVWGQRSLQRHRTRRIDSADVVKNITAQFSSLEEARAYHLLLMRRTYHLIGETCTLIMSAKIEERHIFISDTQGELVDPCHVPLILLRDRDSYLDDLKRWQIAFQAIFVKSFSSKDQSSSVGAAILKVHAIDASMALSGLFFTSECDFDAFISEAKEIVSLSRIIIKKTDQTHSKVVPVFTFAIGLEQALHDVAVMCRDKEVRYEALSLLRLHAPFDSTTLRSRIWTRAAYFVSLEEEGRLPNGQIPESARWRRIYTYNHYDEKFRHMTLVHARRTGFPLGQGYPARREFRMRTFSQIEADSMLFETKDPDFQPWLASLPKPQVFKWRQVHGELLARF